MKPWLVLVVSLATSATAVADVATPTLAQARQSAATPADRIAEAYTQFLFAHRLEDDDDVDGAVAAYRRAMALDPGAAEIVADLASLYMRANRIPEAIAAGEQALQIDPDNQGAHQVLGTIYAAAATSGARRGALPARDESLRLGIQHLEAAIASAVNPDANVRAMLAQLYLSGRNYDKAIPMLEDLIKQEPGWEQGVGLLMDAFNAAGRQRDARRWLEGAASDDPQLYARLGDSYAGDGRWDDAAKSYAQALPVLPRNFDLRVRYASAVLNAGESAGLGEAKSALQDALAMRANDPRAMFLLAQIERRMGALGDAERTARQLVSQDSRNPRGYVALAEVLEERQAYDTLIGDLAPALSGLRAAANPTPALLMVLPHLGFAYQHAGQFDKAVATFEEARALAPDDAIVTAYLVEAQLAAKRYPAALDLVRAARRNHPDEVRLARLEAQALDETGSADQGIALLQSLVERREEDPRAHIALAQAYAEANRGAQAVTTLQNAQLSFPNDTVITFELGTLLDKQKRHDEAESTFRRLLAVEPDNAAALNYLGYILAERGEKLDESVDLVKRALKIEPENGSYLDSLGWAYYKSGNMDLALDNVRRAADQLTRNSVIQDHFGDILFKLSRYDEAIDAWTRALAGDGDSIDRGDIDRKIRSARQRLPKPKGR